jgi:hypothetical protein
VYEYYDSLSYDGNVAGTKVWARKIFVLQIDFQFHFEMVSSEFIFRALCIFAGAYSVFSLELKQYLWASSFVVSETCHTHDSIISILHWVSLSVIGMGWLLLHIPAALLLRKELILLYGRYWNNAYFFILNVAPGKVSCLTHRIATLSSSTRLFGVPVSHVRWT